MGEMKATHLKLAGPAAVNHTRDAHIRVQLEISGHSGGQVLYWVRAHSAYHEHVEKYSARREKWRGGRKYEQLHANEMEADF